MYRGSTGKALPFSAALRPPTATMVASSGGVASAIALFEKQTRELAPHLPATYHNLAVALFASGQLDAAEAAGRAAAAAPGPHLRISRLLTAKNNVPLPLF